MADDPPARPAVTSLQLIAGTIGLGLGLRVVPLGLPMPMTKYGGSLLWAAMIYWIVSFIRPRWVSDRAALASGAIATAVELFKLHHAPRLDAFRHTLAGALLLGRVFSMTDIVAYAVAIAVAALVDRVIRSRSARRSPACS